jgi:hypothetical protein
LTSADFQSLYLVLKIGRMVKISRNIDPDRFINIDAAKGSYDKNFFCPMALRLHCNF